jgi:uncharacterized protein (DUF983 family)
MADFEPLEPHLAIPSPVSAGLKGCCPRCGQGRLFSGFLKLAPKCRACGLDFSFADSADGPAVFIIFIAGFAVMGGVLWLEFTYEPPFWVHMVIWLPLTIGLCLALLRPMKGLAVALQYANKAEEGRFDR